MDRALRETRIAQREFSKVNFLYRVEAARSLFENAEILAEKDYGGLAHRTYALGLKTIIDVEEASFECLRKAQKGVEARWGGLEYDWDRNISHQRRPNSLTIIPARDIVNHPSVKLNPFPPQTPSSTPLKLSKIVQNNYS